MLPDIGRKWRRSPRPVTDFTSLLSTVTCTYSSDQATVEPLDGQASGDTRIRVEIRSCIAPTNFGERAGTRKARRFHLK